MTEVAEAPVAAKSGEIKPISHWIGGRIVEGTSGRSGPVYNPATGEQSAEVDFASVEEVDRAVAGREGGLPGVAGALALAPRRDLLPHPRPRRRAPRGPRASCSPPSTARCSPTRWARSRAGIEVDRVLLRHPAAARRAASRSRPRPASTSTRSASRSASSPGITPFNFPAMVPMWMWAPRTRLRQHVRAEAVGEGSVGVDSHGRAAQARPACPTASSTSCTATRSRSTRCSSTPTSRRSRSSARRRSRSTSTRPATQHGKRVQALGGAKNHMIVLPDADIDMAADAAVSAALRLGRRALHGDLAWSSRSATSRDPLIAGDQGAHPEGEDR